jgi:hypothetical protein
MSWDKTINALASFVDALAKLKIWKYLGMWLAFAIVGSILVLAGFGTTIGEWIFVVAVGFELLAIGAGFACLIVATWLFKVKLEKINDSHQCDP